MVLAKSTTMGMNTKKGANDVKCVIVGDGAVGKTSMLLSYTTGGIMFDYIPTCFDCYTVDMQVREKNYTLSLVDTAGQETYDRLRTLSYYDTDVFIVCFSVADLDSFDNIRTKWIPEIRQYRPNTPFILVGTQVDLRDSALSLSADDTNPDMSSAVGNTPHVPCSCTLSRTTSTSSTTTTESRKQCVSFKKAKSLAKKCGARAYMECSALEGTGVQDVFSSALSTAVLPRKRRTLNFVKSMKSVFKFRKYRDSESDSRSPAK